MRNQVAKIVAVATAAVLVTGVAWAGSDLFGSAEVSATSGSTTAHTAVTTEAVVTSSSMAGSSTTLTATTEASTSTTEPAVKPSASATFEIPGG